MRAIKVRLQALKIVTAWYDRRTAGLEWPQVLDLARQTAAYLTGPSVVRIRVGPVTEQHTEAVADPQPTGARMQLTDTQQVTYTITALDAKGYEVNSVDFSASIDDDAVATVEDQGNTFKVVAGIPGSAVITFTDGTLTATEAIDVVPGNVATVSVTAGPVEEQPAADAGDGAEVAPPVDEGGAASPPVEESPPSEVPPVQEAPPSEVPPVEMPPEQPPDDSAPANPVG